MEILSYRDNKTFEALACVWLREMCTTTIEKNPKKSEPIGFRLKTPATANNGKHRYSAAFASFRLLLR